MKFTSLRQAAQYAGVTRAAVLYWTDLYDIGEQVDGRWYIDKDKFDAFLATRAKIAEMKATIRKIG